MIRFNRGGQPLSLRERQVVAGLKAKRARIAAEMKMIFTAAKAENRGLTADETEVWSNRKAAIGKIDQMLAVLAPRNSTSESE